MFQSPSARDIRTSCLGASVSGPWLRWRILSNCGGSTGMPSTACENCRLSAILRAAQEHTHPFGRADSKIRRKVAKGIQEGRAGPGAKRRGRRKICSSTSTPDQPPCKKRESVSFDPNSFLPVVKYPWQATPQGLESPSQGRKPARRTAPSGCASEWRVVGMTVPGDVG